MIGFDFETTYRDDRVVHGVHFFQPCRMRCRIVERDGGCDIVYQRGSKHGRRYEFAKTFEEARQRVTAWVRRNEREYA